MAVLYVNLATISASVHHYAISARSESVNNLVVPITPLQVDSICDQSFNQYQRCLQIIPSNIPSVMPETSCTAAVEIPSPTLQNIVCTVNLG